MKLTSTHITLRAVEESDIDAIFLFENDPDSTAFSFSTAPLSRNQIWQYVKSYNADIFSAGELRLMIVENESKKVIGTIDITDFQPRDRRGFLGIYITPTYRGNGYALEAINLVLDYARDTLGMHSLAAQVAVDNNISCNLFTSAGFKPSGKLRSWIRKSASSYLDVIIFQKLLA